MALRPLLLALASVCASSAQVRPGLAEVRTVYLLPMTGGLDQYLANQLTRVGRFEVVTDPKLADAVFTDQLGVAFEERWKELYPPPPPPEPPADANTDVNKIDDFQTDSAADLVTAPVARGSTFSRGKGNVFLVSRKTGSVIWSNFEPVRDIRTTTMDRTANRIVDRLEDDLKPKK